MTQYLPAGLVGLVLAVIFAAAMSTISAEINSLATVTVIDIYRRHVRRQASDRHYLWVSRVATVFWGCYAVLFSQFVKDLGSLVEAVNMLGSLFYGGMLGVFVLAFLLPARAGERGVLRRAGGRSGHLLFALVHPGFLPLVQRGRLRRGGGHGPVDLVLRAAG